MKFKELTEQDIEKARDIYWNKELTWDERMKILMDMFGKSERAVRRWCSEKLGFKEKVDVASAQFETAKKRTHDTSKKRFLVSWAQNNSPINSEMFKNMKAYGDFLDAEILIIAGRYSNRLETLSKDTKESWAEEILPYLTAKRNSIHKHIDIVGDIKINATTQNVLAGLNGITGEKSSIFGSPRLQMSTVPFLHGRMPKIVMTTGALTIENYTDSRIGQLSFFHHCFGFAIIEIKDEEIFYVRQVPVCKNGSFIDLLYSVKNQEVSKIDSISGIVLGDLHVGDHDPEVIEKTLKLLEKIKPDNVIIHDAFNGSSINHHEALDPFIQYEREMNNTNSLKDEVSMLLKELEKFEKYNTVIVKSNHDTFVDRWLSSTDWRKASTPKNSLEYMIYSAAILSGEAKNGIIPWVINKRFPKFITLGDSDSFVVDGYELAIHSHIGANGGKPSTTTFRKLNTKMVVGHSHSPERFENVLRTGTSTKLNLKYTQGGATSWMQSHVILHKNKKAQHIFFVNGDFTTFE